MTTPTPSPRRRASAANPRLRASPAFVMSQTLDGRPFVAQDTEPYLQYWLSERYRLLLALFGARRGLRVDEALAAWHRLHGSAAESGEDRLLRRAIDDLRSAGVLVGVNDDPSRYDHRIVDHYIAHRPLPAPLLQHLVQAGGIGPGTRVLDLAGGPGCLALALAEVSKNVSMMELSRGFVAAAGDRARARGLPLRVLHESANRLSQGDGPFDVVTVSQALHWLDDVQVARGVARTLAAGGSFFVVHSAIELPDAHPLAWLLGHDSVLGRKEREPFADEVQPLLERLALLLQALDGRRVQRVDVREAAAHGLAPLGVAGVRRFEQRRPFGPGYARGFITPRHVERSGLDEATFWRRVHEGCAGAGAERLAGTHHWAVLHFRRGEALGRGPEVAAQPVERLDAMALPA